MITLLPSVVSLVGLGLWPRLDNSRFGEGSSWYYLERRRITGKKKEIEYDKRRAPKSKRLLWGFFVNDASRDNGTGLGGADMREASKSVARIHASF